jgi:hypothetical protein
MTAMGFADIFLAQIIDPFRIALVIMLVLTAARTSATVGSLIPLALGVVFVAVLIPVALGGDHGERTLPIAVGLVSNAVILSVVLAAKAALGRLTRPKP